MSLYKQLWLAIIFLMSLTFLGSFVVSNLSAKAYLQEQLYRKNLDNASTLALSLSSELRDAITTELFINAQYDTGHYQFIRLIDANGELVVEQVDSSDYREAPQWLITLFPIEIEAGVAHVSNGWQQIGTLSLSSQPRFAYKQLWDNTKRLFYYFVTVSIIGGLLGSLILKLIISPLDRAVDQATAIGERRFITTREPKTLEFRAVISSMNKLSARVKSMLDDESAKLEKLRADLQVDEVTGLLNREPTFNHLRSFLEKNDVNAEGSILLIRLVDLLKLNTIHGRQAIDTLLKRFGSLLNAMAESDKRLICGRLNGSDFLILMPTHSMPELTAKRLQEHLEELFSELKLQQAKMIIASTPYHFNNTLSELMTRVDNGLASLSADQNSMEENYVHIESENLPTESADAGEWKMLIEDALNEQRFQLQKFPVYDKQQHILHWEAPARLLQKNGELLTAGQFIPPMNRLGLISQLDLTVVELALNMIAESASPIGVNLSSSLLNEPETISKLTQLVSHHRDAAKHLWLEVPEYGAFQHLEGFRTLCHLLKPLQCRLGIEHVGRQVAHIGELHDLGLDYVKIDIALTHDIDNNTANQIFLRGFCTIVHSIGLRAIAEGVSKEGEWKKLIELGVDGGTGRYFM